MAKVTARLEGWREASRKLNDLSKGMAQGVGKRALQVPADMLRAEVRLRAPELTGALKRSINVAPDKTQRGAPRVQVRVDDIAAVQAEFGNSKQTATPFFEPSVQGAKGQMFEAFAEALRLETDRVVAKVAKKAGRGQ